MKSLNDIEKIGHFNEEFGKFHYYIEEHHEEYPIEFIDNSVVITNNNMKIDYFRDIGEPSRDIVTYTNKNIKKMKRNDDDYDI